MEQTDSCYQGGLGINYKKEGKGIVIYDDGFLYVGEFKNDNFHGSGLLCLPYGTVLCAQFDKSIISGKL